MIIWNIYFTFIDIWKTKETQGGSFIDCVWPSLLSFLQQHWFKGAKSPQDKCATASE